VDLFAEVGIALRWGPTGHCGR